MHQPPPTPPGVTTNPASNNKPSIGYEILIAAATHFWKALHKISMRRNLYRLELNCINGLTLSKGLTKKDKGPHQNPRKTFKAIHLSLIKA